MPSSTNNKHNDADNEYEDNSTAIFFKQRPVRHGMWFIAHKSTADEMRDSLDLQEEPLNIWDEFFAHHPVGDAYCQNFVALQLSEETLYQNRERVRCASYRWEDVKGVGVDGKEYQAPSNYVWFFKWIEKHNVLGWMDFTANIGVNVSGRDTVGYMGSLYADFITASHWMEDSMLLELALGRGWIFQETTFGSFDSAGIALVLDEMRDLGLSTLATSPSSRSLEERVETCLKFCKKAVHLSKLLDRRGYYALAQSTDILCDRQYGYYDEIGHHNYGPPNVAEVLVKRVFGDVDDIVSDERIKTMQMRDKAFLQLEQIMKDGTNVGYTAMLHLCDIFTQSEEPVFRWTYQVMHKLLTDKTWENISNINGLFEKIGDPIVAAYSSLQVSYETDREDAVTRVARSVIKTSYGEEYNYDTFSQKVWEGAAQICLKTEGTIGTTVLHFPPSIPEGMRFLGGISVTGARLDGNGRYMTQGKEWAHCSWTFPLVTAYAMHFQWVESRSLWTLPLLEGDDENENENGENNGQDYYDIFICTPPKGTQFFCGYVAQLASASASASPTSGSGASMPVYAQFFTAQNPPSFPTPAIECIFC